MRWQGYVFSEPGPPHTNEDFGLVTDHAVIVADGASELGGAISSAWQDNSAVAWFSSTLTREFGLRLPGVDARSALASAIDEVAGLWRARTGDREEDLRLGPSCALAFAREFDGNIEIGLLGDCSALVRDTAGAVTTLQDPTLPHLDAKALLAMRGHANDEDIPVRQARARIQDMLREHRWMRNTEGGYAVADLTGAGVAGMTLHRFDPDLFADVVLMTDGFAIAVDCGAAASTTALVTEVAAGEAAAVGERIRSRLMADPDLALYPRFKTVDDMTAVYGLPLR